jgi:hypothetical protein
MKKLWKEVLLFWLGMAFLAAWSNTLGPIARQKENADLTGTLYFYSKVGGFLLFPLGMLLLCFVLLRLTNRVLPWRVPWKALRIVLGVLSGLVVLGYLYQAMIYTFLPGLPYPQFLGIRSFNILWHQMYIHNLPGLLVIFLTALGLELAFPPAADPS